MVVETKIVPLERAQRAVASEVLARAFFDDPLTVWMMPDESRRMRGLEWFMGTGARYAMKYGHVDTTANDVRGAGCWLPPGETDMSLVRMVRGGMYMAPFKFGLGAFSRFMSAMDQMEELHKRDMPPEHWYLMILGVDPDHQGRGLGCAIIAPTLARADAEGLPCYLETMKEINVTFYRKHGFEVIVDDHLPKGGPRYWTMRREPRS